MPPSKSVLLALCISVSFCFTYSSADQATAQHPSAARTITVAEIAAEASAATVVIKALRSNGAASAGSGFLVESEGTVLTNLHVVSDSSRIEVKLSSGDIYEVRNVRAVDRRRDIAILDIPGFQLPTIPLGNSDDISAGARVIVIGHALGVLENSVTTGVISGIREIEGHTVFQMDAAVSAGNSGGPVLDENGSVIGITVFKVTAGESLNFAIPINYARGLLQVEQEGGLSLLGRDTREDSLFLAGSALSGTWRSLTHGPSRTVKQAGDYLYVDVNFPNARRESGEWAKYEFKKSGEQWSGLLRQSVACGSFTISPKQCMFEFEAHLTRATPDRIEGWALIPPSNARLRCGSCTYTKPFERTELVWIPE